MKSVQLDFNTSHVNVNLRLLCLPCLPFSISIHLMLMLIQKSFAIGSSESNFNTSHVNVNLIWHYHLQDQKANFNTSHVNVNQTWESRNSYRKYISIHLMLMLIWNITGSQKLEYTHFNTSHVNVNRMYLP